MSSTFCAAIHHHINLTPKGYIEPCCVWYKDDLDQEFKFTELEKYKASDQLKGFKQALDSDVKLPHCRMCWKQEAMGQESQRMMYNRYLTREENKISSVEFKLGNLCDLKCVMCNGENSSQITTEYKMHKKKFDLLPKTYFIKPGSPTEFSWPESEEFKKFTDQIGNDLREIILTGGEPTIIPYVARLLSNISQPEHVRLTMITNGNSMNTKLVEILKKFKHVNVVISLDGVGEHNDQIRFNSQWDQVVENIQRYKELPNTNIKINHVLQAFSVVTLLPLIHWTEQQGLRLRFTPLFDPQHLTLNSVPATRINEFINELSTSSNPIALYVIKELANHSYDPELEQHRRAHLALLDEIRNTNLSKLI